MKAWAKSFYLSQAWENTRAAYLMSQDYICERCGEPAKIAHHKRYLTRENINDAGITLSWDNLEALCQDCHNKEHHKRKPRLRYKFDAAGGISPPIRKSKLKGENTEGDTLKLPSGRVHTWCRGCGGVIWQRQQAAGKRGRGNGCAEKEKRKPYQGREKKT